MNFNPQNSETSNNKNKRKRKIIWFNPPYSKNVSTNVGKFFLNLIEKHFPNHHKYRKLFNKNNLKVSYSCMNNLKSLINGHNKFILNEDKDQRTKKCNCVNKNECPLGNECQTSNIVYKAELSCNNPNYQTKAYIGISATTFKQCYANHKKIIQSRKIFHRIIQ